MEFNKRYRVLDRMHTVGPQLKYASLVAALLVVTLLLLGPSSISVRAASFAVTTTIDTVDAVPGDGSCADAQGNCSLRAAIMEANANGEADTIDLPSGVYTLVRATTGENAGVDGDLDITSNITITGAGSGSTIIDGNKSDRVLDILSGTFTLSGFTVTNGLAPSAEGGGGLFVGDEADVTASNIVIEFNDVASSEGVTAGGIYNSGMLTLNNSEVLSNTAQFGGGIYNVGTIIVDQSTIKGNADDAAFGGAGGILNNGGTLTVTRSAISTNSNGGLTLLSGTSLLENVTVSGNSDFGLKAGAAGLTVTHSTIVNNGASGISLDGGVPQISHSILYGHEVDCSGFVSSSGYNLDGDNSCGLLAAGDISGSSPLLGSLADNGGTTKTHALLDGSPALNAGDPAYTAPPATDQRGPGFPRVQLDRIDIGAYERADFGQGGQILVNTVEDTDDGLCGVGHCSLREALSAGFGEGWIGFEIPGAGPHIIQPISALPAMEGMIGLDGGSVQGAEVVLDGSLAGADTPGISINGNDNALYGLEIRNFDGPGVLVTDGAGNWIQGNSIHDNGGLGIDLGDDGVSPNDYQDIDAGPNDLLNYPTLLRIVNDSGTTFVQGFITGQPGTTVGIDIYANASCDSSYFGEGETYISTIDDVTIEANGYNLFTDTLPVVLPNGSGVAATTVDSSYNTSEFSRCLIAGPNNDAWPNALEIPLSAAAADGSALEGSAAGFISTPGQSRWFRFPVAPNSTVIVDLTDLPANYDLILFRDIAKKYSELSAPADLDALVELSAEFAPDMFSPDMFSPDMFSPDMFSPDMFSPDMFSPDMFSPDMFSPDIFSPDMFSPDMFSPDMFSPDMFSPDMFSPDMFSPDKFSPDMFSADMFSPDMLTPDQRYFASAQIQSAVAVSSYDGTSDETVVANAWSEGGDFYVRVRGRNGVYNPAASFDLNVTVLDNGCAGLTDFEFTPDTSGIVPGGINNLILADFGRMVGPEYADLPAMQVALNGLASGINGEIVDLGQFSAIAAANLQADASHGCVFAKNLVAYAIKDVVDAYRDTNPIENVVVVGNDNIIPFFRYPDQGLLANEDNYEPPVQDLTTSQASLRLGYVLSQDTYGASVELDRRNGSLPVPEIPVGRLVEQPHEIITVIETFLANGGVVPAPSRALVTGYDFLDDGAIAVQSELEIGLDSDGSEGPAGTVNTLISAATVAPSEAWNASQLRTALLESGRHDLVYLAGHFSGYSTLAADYETRLLASEVASSSVDMSNSIIFSAGCHSGYNIVNEHSVPGFTIVEPDWAQTFAQKGALLIAGTGYQYGDSDFVEYSERLYLEFARALRAGAGPVSAGEALVRAKQIYLADTAQMRPIHEKVLLEATIFGLPMLTVDLPDGRGTVPGEDSIVTPPLSDFGTNPGLTLGLQYADVTVTLPITAATKTLESVEDGTGVITTYFEGEDGLVINPGEPVRPLDQFNVSVPNTVLRGIGFRGGDYSDHTGIIPLTGAATTELRGIHTPFISPVFYPIVPWEANHFDALANSAASGETRLAVIPAQYRSRAATAVDGTMRTFDNMSFRLYYNDNTSSYENSGAGITNTPSLASPLVINKVLAKEDGGSVTFSVEVTGDPSAGIQEVWLTYTALSGPYAGQWQSVDLTQDPNESTLWTASLPLSGTQSADIRFMVQAANGVGLVSLATNRGAYYIPGIDPGDPPTPPGDITPAPAEQATIELLSLPANGPYGTAIEVRAELLDANNLPLAGKPVEFGLTTQRISAQTDSNGLATVNLTLISEPAVDHIRVSFDGDSSYAPAADSTPFEILPIATHLVLVTETPTFTAGGSADITISLTDDTGRPLREKSVLIVADDGTNFFGEAVITNLYGNAVVNSINWPVEDSPFTVNAYFGSTVAINGVEVDLTNPRYLASTTSLQLIENTAPAAAAGGPYSAAEGSVIELDAGGSSDVDKGQVLTYYWDLDHNGSYETEGQTTAFSAAALDGPSSAVVRLQVCDPLGDCDVESADITIDNVPPIITDIGSDGPVFWGEPVTIFVNATDPADSLTYAFDCDNDNNFETGPQRGNSTQCVFFTSGDFKVNVRVKDGDGGKIIGSIWVQVTNWGSGPVIFMPVFRIPLY